MGTLVLAVDPGPGPSYGLRRGFARSKRWEALLKRKPLYPAFIKACWKAEAGGIPTLEEFNRFWPPEMDRVAYVSPEYAEWVKSLQSTDPPSNGAPR